LINVDSSVHEEAARAFISARKATACSVSAPDLYAYVSRGLVRSVGASRSGGHQYLRQDVERLLQRKHARSGHAAVAASALRWGEPVLDSKITAIDERGPRYRGQLATALVQAGRRFEEVAELLWSGNLPAEAPRWSMPRGSSAQVARSSLPRARPLSRMIGPLAMMAATEPIHPLAAPAELERARSLLLLLASHAGPRIVRPRASIAETLAVALGVSPTRRAVAAIDAALVLLADHELNASSFTARVAASAGAGLGACLLAAHMTLTGMRHGGEAAEVERLVAAIGRSDRVRRVLLERMRSGAALPGFHHTLYPAGDPRAVPLLALAKQIGPRRSIVKIAHGMVRHVGRARGDRPTVDLGLVALAGTLGAPPGSAGVLFAIGRVAGWVAHVLEQRAQGFLLRPRARYIGA
jgi:citrate synthase